MIYTRHMRAIGTRGHFDWSANGDSLPDMEPVHAEEFQREPLDGYRPSWLTYVGVGVLAFLLVAL